MEHFVDRVVGLFEIIHPLDRIPRAGYVLRGVPEPESVAAHAHFVALLALLLADEYPDLFDHDKTLAMALIHDLSEARLMDIPMPYADAYMSDAKSQAEQAVIEDLFREFPRAMLNSIKSSLRRKRRRAVSCAGWTRRK